MQTTCKFFFSCLLCLGLLLASGCGGRDAPSGESGSTSTAAGSSQHPSEFVGKWEDNFFYGRFMELFEDGSGTNRNLDRFTWKVENGRFHMSYGPGATGVFDYTISGSTLTFIGDNRSIEGTFTKQGNP
jgi:hypothetical protein